MKEETLCARPVKEPVSATRPLVPPIQMSAVYELASLDQVDALYEGKEPGFVYARDGHPNARQLAEKVARLEGAEAAWVAASGMGAEAAVMLALLGKGDRLAVAQGVYGKSARLSRELERFGVEVVEFDSSKPDTLARVLDERAKVVFAETLSNPLLRLADLEGLAEKAHEAGAALVIDHTFAPGLCRPVEMGADLVTHSATKLLGGHSDLTLGLVAGRQELTDRIASVGSTFGMTGNPFESWLALRGLATFPIRLDRACSSALRLAERLAEHGKVHAVHYPGLPTHADHARAKRMLGERFGTVVTIDLGGREQADRLVRGLQGEIPFAPSLGDVSTTLSHPATTSHRGQSPDQWSRQGITDGLVRLSVGLEDVDDLWSALRAGLEGV